MEPYKFEDYQYKVFHYQKKPDEIYIYIKISYINYRNSYFINTSWYNIRYKIKIDAFKKNAR